ncbi:hypothetical protein BASA81_011021 [Batrachochytrium salamandrivorans]|nr:hypothetical protein BASA81_011021 [Batrachochytrium salamandrivorans]
MFRFPAQPREVSLGLAEVLTKMCGQGEHFEYTLSGTREQVSKSSPKTLLVNLQTDSVVVINNNPLSIGLDGEKMLLRQFKVLRNDFSFAFEGLEFMLGENLVIRVGKMKKLQSAAEMCDFCDIRWAASGSSWDSPQMALEVLQKFAPPALVAQRKQVAANFAKVPAHVSFGSQHQALQFVKLYEDVMADRN